MCSVLLKSMQDVARTRKKCREKHETWFVVSPYFSSALAALFVPCNRTLHTQGFFICFIMKNPLNSQRISFNF